MNIADRSVGALPRHARRSHTAVWLATLSLLPLALSGCGSLFDEGAAAGAGVIGATVASKLSASAAVTSGIGLGALAAAQSGAKYVEKRAHQREQDTIAERAGALAAGQVADWKFDPKIKLEPEEHGHVTVSRVIAAGALECKEIVFSVDTIIKHVHTTPITASTQSPLTSDAWQPERDTHQAPRDIVTYKEQPISAFYVATICRDGATWKWASAEPATERWGALQ
ncbi:hypothetical protein [Robbsia sp. KACC 23696]|uniref:hypothetical protein n=1 Tax=Robbsia sp. KACC 23696 TaxID=3149231 RepID=UPI00325AB323